MILITGATGTTGSEIVRQLAGRDIKVRAMVRDPSKVGNWGDVEVVTADFDKPDTIRTALKGVERVYLVTPPGENMKRRQLDFIDIAVKSGVKRIVRLSVIGAGDADRILLNEHNKLDEKLINSGLDYVILRPNFFMQNLFAVSDTIRENGVIHYPAGEAKVSMVDVRDIASVAVEALVTDDYLGRSLDITGPEAITFTEVAEHIGYVDGKDVKFVDVPPDKAIKAMIDSGMTEWMAKGLVDLFDGYKMGIGDKVTDTVREITGEEPISFRQFVIDHGSMLDGKKVA